MNHNWQPQFVPVTVLVATVDIAIVVAESHRESGGIPDRGYGTSSSGYRLGTDNRHASDLNDRRLGSSWGLVTQDPRHTAGRAGTRGPGWYISDETGQSHSGLIVPLCTNQTSGLKVETTGAGRRRLDCRAPSQAAAALKGSPADVGMAARESSSLTVTRTSMYRFATPILSSTVVSLGFPGQMMISLMYLV
jgi:hypothetical protein